MGVITKFKDSKKYPFTPFVSKIVYTGKTNTTLVLKLFTTGKLDKYKGAGLKYGKAKDLAGGTEVAFDKIEDGIYTKTITGLNPDTLYYVKGYVVLQDNSKSYKNAKLRGFTTTPDPTATIEDVTVSGDVNVEIEPFDIIVNIQNDEFSGATNEGTNLATWVTNLPTGLTAKAKSKAEIGSDSIIILIEGTPTEAIDEPIVIKIPNAKLEISTTDLVVTENKNAKFVIQEE